MLKLFLIKTWSVTQSIMQGRVRLLNVLAPQSFLKIISAVLTVSEIISSGFILLGTLLKDPAIPYAHRVSGKGDAGFLSTFGTTISRFPLKCVSCSSRA